MSNVRPITTATLPMKVRVILHRRRDALERIRNLHTKAPLGNAHRCTECGFPAPCQTALLADAGLALAVSPDTAAPAIPRAGAAPAPTGADTLGSAIGAGGGTP